MDQMSLGNFSKLKKMDTLTRDELIKQNEVLQHELGAAIKEIYKLKNQNLTDAQLQLILSEQLTELQNMNFGSSSERFKKPENKKKIDIPDKPRIKKPSERYPNCPVRSEKIELAKAPACEVCGDKMKDSGLVEESEQLTVIPKKFEILRIERVKYRCQCQACIITAPMPPRIVPGSSYSNEMIIDVAVSKYCDLTPIERYVQMAGRGGLIDLPPHSLIELTHAYADFLSPIYILIEQEALNERSLRADETPHKMLEGSQTKNWYLWGFSSPTACYLECRNTRAGSVASDFLLKSKCEVLLTDVFSGYNKACNEVNEIRAKNGLTKIKNANCNAHARRYFFKAQDHYKDADLYLEDYHQIYILNKESKGKPPDEVLELRSQMRSRFESMKKRALEELILYPQKNKYNKALGYFLSNYEGLTLFLADADVEIDNNGQERILRSHVVGRKTWYGTHSERGSFTAAVLFTIIETCKLNNVNPREYLKKVTDDILAGNAPYSPKSFKVNSMA